MVEEKENQEIFYWVLSRENFLKIIVPINNLLKNPKLIYNSLTEISYVIQNYSSPFLKNEGYDLDLEQHLFFGKGKENIKKLLDAEQLKTHDKIIRLRKKKYGHQDPLDYKIVISRLPQQDMVPFNYSIAVSQDFLSEYDLKKLSDINKIFIAYSEERLRDLLGYVEIKEYLVLEIKELDASRKFIRENAKHPKGTYKVSTTINFKGNNEKKNND